MLLNFKDPLVKAAIRPLFEDDCRRVAGGEIPVRAWETDIYVTRRCNMRCSYCYVKDYFDRDYPFVDPTMEQLKILVDKLAEKTYGLVVLGGEPLIRTDLAEFLAYARARGIPSIRIPSNGTLVKQSTAALRLIDRLNISVDSTRKREYPAVIEKMLADVKEVKALMGAEFPAICLSYTLAQGEEFDRDIRPLVEYAAENGFDIKFLPCKYPNKDVNWPLLREVLSNVRNYLPDEQVLNIRPLTEQITHEFLFQNCLQEIQFYIDFEGYFLYPCDEYPDQRVAKIYDHSIAELWNMGREKFGSYPCAQSPVCRRCKSYCHAENSYNYRHPEREQTFLS